MSSNQKVKARKCHNQGKRAKCALYEGHTGECDLKVLVRGKWFPKLKPKPPAPGKAVELSRKDALAKVMYAGNGMSNLCFNLSQVKGEYQKMFKECYLEWDSATRLYRECVAPSKG